MLRVRLGFRPVLPPGRQAGCGLSGTQSGRKDALVARASSIAEPASWNGRKLFTIGHSTRSLDAFVALLRDFDITVLADIRTIPRSRHNPQFDTGALPGDLWRAGIGYIHLPRLGGLRKPRADSVNTGWRNASFRGFADYMGTQDFQEGLDELRRLATSATVALMCAEAVPWRCHRSLVADALVACGASVEHIIGPQATSHHLTDFAVLHGTRVTYPGAGRLQGSLFPGHS
jgi:uncharacterized protein (DUF488 family)